MFDDEVTNVPTTYIWTFWGEYFVILPADNEHGFSLHSEFREWPGGVGLATRWMGLPATAVPADVRKRLGHLLTGKKAPAVLVRAPSHADEPRAPVPA